MVRKGCTDRTGEKMALRVAWKLLMVIAAAGLSFSAFSQDWPDWRGAGRNGTWTATGIVKSFSAGTIPPRWKIPVGSGYSGPTVAAGKVYLTDRSVKPEETERVVCVDAATGKMIWTYSYPCPYENMSYPAGPRASVVINSGKAYSLGTMGHLFCFDAVTGNVLWKHDLNSEYQVKMPTWGIAATPLVHGNSIIMQIGGSRGASILALDKNTGKELWRSQDDEISYSAPVIIKQAGKNVVVVWTAENLNGLDPETGKVYWKIPFKVGMGMAIATPVLYNEYLFVSSFYRGSMLVRLGQNSTTAEKVWMRAGENERKTDALHCVINTPLIRDGYIYGVDSYGELRCLDLLTGDRVWEDLTAVRKDRWANIHFICHDRQVWMFNEHGELLITELSPKGLKIISRAKLIDPTPDQLNRKGGGVAWSHPAFAGPFVYARNDRELVCAYLGEQATPGR